MTYPCHSLTQAKVLTMRIYELDSPALLHYYVDLGDIGVHHRQQSCRRVLVTEGGKWAQYRRCLHVDVWSPRKRKPDSYRVTTRDAWYTVEIDGRVVYGTRTYFHDEVCNLCGATVTNNTLNAGGICLECEVATCVQM